MPISKCRHGYDVVHTNKGSNIWQEFHNNRNQCLKNSVWGRRYLRVRQLVNTSMILGPTANVLACAPQGRPATFSRGMKERKHVSSDTWTRAGTSTIRMIHLQESRFQLILVCKIFMFFTLAMSYGKRVDFQEVPLGYDENQQNCHWFCFKLFLKKGILQFRKSLSSHLLRRALCVSLSKFQHKARESWTQKLARRSTSRWPAAWSDEFDWF